MLKFSIGKSYHVEWNVNLKEYEFYNKGELMPKKIDTLYKYMPFNEFTISSLLSRYLWLANPSTFNDPFDCNKNLIINHPDNFEQTKDKKNSHEDIGIISFTEKLNNPLMWAHYTNNYNGIVLEFDASNFHQNNTEQFSEYKLRKVIYPEYIAPLQTGFQFAEDIMFSSKIKNWEYEEEWRIIGRLKNAENRYLNFNPRSLKNIYIGYNLFENNSTAFNILSQIQYLNYPEVKIYYVYPNPDRFGSLVFKKINFD